MTTTNLMNLNNAHRAIEILSENANTLNAETTIIITVATIAVSMLIIAGCWWKFMKQ